MKFLLVSSMIFGSLVLQSCAAKKDKQNLVQIDSDFSAFVTNFEAASKNMGRSGRISDLVVEFGSTPSMNETGVCEITEGETPRVTINERIWTNLSVMDRQEVIFHELGHCVLRRQHQEGTVTVGGYWGTIPSSIMYPYRIPGSIYEPNQEYYDGELFDASKMNAF